MPIKVFKQQWVLAVIVTLKCKYKKEKEQMSNLQIRRYFLNPPKKNYLFVDRIG